MTGVVVWFTGLPASGKTTLAERVRERLGGVLLDSDELRDALGTTEYTPKDRDDFYRRLGALAALLAHQGQLVLVAATAPLRVHRDAARALVPRFVEVWVATPLAECERRDPKGLYSRARAGDAPTLPGVGAPYEPPVSPEITAGGGADEEAIAAIERRVRGPRPDEAPGDPGPASPSTAPTSRAAAPASQNTMRAMVLERVGSPLVLRERERPRPATGEVRIAIEACAVCRTDLHVVDGELPDPRLPIIVGHQITGVVDALGEGVTAFAIGDRVGVPWLGWTCGRCTFCTSGRENLCREARFTGYTRDGGFAEACVADARFVLQLPREYSAIDAAPLLCGALIGYRAFRLAGEGRHLGIYGFGSAAHMIAQVALHAGREVYAFTRRGDTRSQAFARELGATWAGDSDRKPPVALDGAIIFAPAGELVPLALAATSPGGTVVCGGIHMSDIPSFPYRLLWEERVLRSVANLTRRDGEELLTLAPAVGLRAHLTRYRLEDANRALDDLRAGRFDGTAVLDMTR